MKSLAQPRHKEEILRRLATIQPQSRGNWGRMSAHQMVCHLSDGFRTYMNLKALQPAPVGTPPALLRFVALWVPLPWPHGFKTLPELDHQAGGTQPVDLTGMPPFSAL